MPEPAEASSNKAPVTAYVGVGANLGDAAATVRAAIAEIQALPGVACVEAAPLYLSAPVDSHGPDYVNTVLRIGTALAAPELLRALQAIELAHGRVRPYRNAPRTLDLDLLLYGDTRIDTAELQVPHPRMMQRAFVLAPLAELAPDLAVEGTTVAAALARCPEQVTKLHNNA